MRRIWMQAAVAATALAAVTPASGAPSTTLSRTIEADQAQERLKPGPGDDYLVREDLATARGGRATDREDLLFFAQMTDSHVIDEESPLRVEFTDKYGLIFNSAYRPQEGLTAQVLDQMIENLRNAESPVANGRDLDLIIQTGDNTDNSQCNETLWMIDVMTGDRAVTPDSGLPRDALPSTAYSCEGAARPLPPAKCPAQSPAKYEGVRGGDYYEPDGDSDAANPYGPLRNYVGLLLDEQQCFVAEGFDDIPWYAVFGNHDGLIQGNAPRNPGYEALGTGPVKVTGLSATDTAAITTAPDRDAALAQAFRALSAGASAGTPGARQIEPDRRRKPLSKNQYIQEHLNDSAYGHGFSPANAVSGQGNYVLFPAGEDDEQGALRFIVLDTISEHGLENGNLDDAQFRWVHQQLLEADEAGQIAVLFGHHSLETMGQPPISPFVPGDTGGSLDPNVHFGLGPRDTGIQLPCAFTDAALPTYPTETLKCLMLRHPSAVAFVNGHEHNNRIDPFRDERRGFWELNTAAHIDFPQQSRLIDLVDNCDGTLSIFGTLVDHQGSANPGEASSTDPTKLAGISRELSYFDYQSRKEGARGGEDDRNVELLVDAPPAYRAARAC
ncbi:MAG: hypothetical protein WKF96_20335 [Solirubrobacteraceae bacterium]